MQNFRDRIRKKKTTTYISSKQWGDKLKEVGAKDLNQKMYFIVAYTLGINKLIMIEKTNREGKEGEIKYKILKGEDFGFERGFLFSHTSKEIGETTKTIHQLQFYWFEGDNVFVKKIYEDVINKDSELEIIKVESLEKRVKHGVYRVLKVLYGVDNKRRSDELILPY